MKRIALAAALVAAFLFSFLAAASTVTLDVLGSVNRVGRIARAE